MSTVTVWVLIFMYTSIAGVQHVVSVDNIVSEHECQVASLYFDKNYDPAVNKPRGICFPVTKAVIK